MLFSALLLKFNQSKIREKKLKLKWIDKTYKELENQQYHQFYEENL